MERIKEPFRLILIDNHRDDQPVGLGDILSCGSWVLRARELPTLLGDVKCGSQNDIAGIKDDAPIYISIDLDALGPEWARTNWDQGDMSLDALLGIISALDGLHRIIGVDICGGITRSQGASDEDLEINLRTRETIQEFLLSLQD